jgi:hypothetical protein
MQDQPRKLVLRNLSAGESVTVANLKGELGSSEIGSGEVRSIEMGSSEVGASEIGFVEIGFIEVGSSKVGFLQKDTLEVCAPQVG